MHITINMLYCNTNLKMIYHSIHMIIRSREMMDLTKEEYRNFVEILKEELTPAFGCTEPIAIAYCAAKARETLGCLPEKVVIEASGNIIKNVKSVIVPNTGRLKGIPAAAAAGIVAGEA